jgi:hypothetical protein
MAWKDDDDWVGEPPEGRHSRDRAKPEHWNQAWKLRAVSALGFLVLIVILVLVLLLG